MARLLHAAALVLLLGTLVSAQEQCLKLPELLDSLQLSSFKQLLQMMATKQDPNFQDILDEARPLTMFAPTDAAISHRGWQLGLKNLGDELSGANTTLIWPIMQYHVVQGAGIDFVNYPSTIGTFFYTDLGMSTCLEGVMPVGLTVDNIVSKTLNADQQPDLLVSAVQQKTPVLQAKTTCNGISRVYVIDDLLTPCCTNLFDLRLSPALGPIFDSENTKPMAKRFFQNIASQVFVNTDKPDLMWRLPKTMFVPKEDALDLFLNDTVGDKPDGRKAVKLYASLSMYHLSNTSATKQEVLAAGSLPVTTWATGNSTCKTQFTIEAYAEKDGIPRLRAKGGNNTVNIEAVFELCGNTTLYVIDEPLLPCDWEEIIPCTQYFDVQDNPRVQALINSTDPAKVAFTSIFSGYLTDNGTSKTWQLPTTLFIPDGAAISKLVTPYLKYDENEDGKGDTFNKYSLGLMKTLTEYHMSEEGVKPSDLAAGKSVTVSMQLAGSATDSCQQKVTISPTAAPAANGKATAPALQVKAGNSTANVVASFELCKKDDGSSTNVYILDNVLMPCKLQELLPCTEFFEVQRYPELKATTESQDPLVKSFMGQFAGAVTQGEGAAAKWVLPKTVFFPSEAAIKAALPEWIGDQDLDAYRSQLIFQLVAYTHLSDQASGAKLLRSSLSRSLNLTTWLSGNSTRSCQTSVTLTYAVDPRTNQQTDQLVVVAGNSTAKVVKSFETCGGTNVYTVDKLLMPCHIEEFLPCQQFYDVAKDDVFLPFMNTSEKYIKAFRGWMTGHIYKNGKYNLPGTLFIPSGDAIAQSLQPWLKTNIGKKLYTESRKKVWETMTTYYMGVDSLDPKAFLQQAAQEPGYTFNMTTQLAKDLGNKAPCSQNLILSVSNDTGVPAIKIQAGNSTANVIAHYSLCSNKYVYVVDNALYPCMMAQTFKKASAAGMLTQGVGALVAAVMALVMLFMQ